MIKLSECRDEHLFLHNEEIVGLQYLLRMIWNDTLITPIRFIKNDNNFNTAISDALDKMYQDVQNDIENEEYILPNLNTEFVVIDITKNDIEQINEFIYRLKNIDKS